jgi:hypothetical protein
VRRFKRSLLVVDSIWLGSPPLRLMPSAMSLAVANPVVALATSLPPAATNAVVLSSASSMYSPAYRQPVAPIKTLFIKYHVAIVNPFRQRSSLCYVFSQRQLGALQDRDIEYQVVVS